MSAQHGLNSGWQVGLDELKMMCNPDAFYERSIFVTIKYALETCPLSQNFSFDVYYITLCLLKAIRPWPRSPFMVSIFLNVFIQ